MPSPMTEVTEKNQVRHGSHTTSGKGDDMVNIPGSRLQNGFTRDAGIIIPISNPFIDIPPLD